MTANAIQTEKLTKYYGRIRGIDKLDLTVETGEFFGFIGPNGAGKSTCIRTLLGLISATSGKAQILGTDVGPNKKEILRRIGYLPSGSAFYSGMRVRDVLKLSADLRRQDCSARAKELCERLQLDPSRRADNLSFGNKKKVGIVCALQHDPELLILDEPTGGLDPLMQHEFFSILQEQNRKGVTVFLSSHILSEVQRYCTRAAVIREGSIVACDNVEALSHTSARRVSLRGCPDLSALSGISDRVDAGDATTFLYNGEINALICALAGSDVQDLTIAEPDLEEIFLHFYGKGGEQA